MIVVGGGIAGLTAARNLLRQVSQAELLLGLAKTTPSHGALPSSLTTFFPSFLSSILPVPQAFWNLVILPPAAMH